MKAFVLAESTDAQRALCAGARTIADEVVLAVVKGAPLTGVADKAYDVELPEGQPVENAAAGVQAAYEAAQPDVVLVEPTPRNKILAGLLAAKLGTAVVSDVTAFDGDTVTNMYFGGLAASKQKATGAKVYTVAGTAFAEAEATGSDDVETIAYVAPEKALVLRGTKAVPREGADLTKCDVVVGAGRGFAEEADLQMARRPPALRLALSSVALVLWLRTLIGCPATSTSAFPVFSLLPRLTLLSVFPVRCSTW